MSPLQRQLEQMGISDRLATVLGEIIDDPMIAKMILLRDAGLWGAAVEALRRYDDEGHPSKSSPGADR
jgi:hypothetical protein